MEAIATVATPHGSEYLQQLCQHWGHRREVEFDAVAGRVAFTKTALHLAATPGALRLTIAGPDAAALDRMEGVVAEHLQRFAFEALVVAWVQQ